MCNCSTVANSRFSARLKFIGRQYYRIFVLCFNETENSAVYAHTHTHSTRWRGKMGHKREVLCLKSVFINSQPTVKNEKKNVTQLAVVVFFFFVIVSFKTLANFAAFCVDDFFFFTVYLP